MFFHGEILSFVLLASFRISTNRPFPSSHRPLFQRKAKCEVFVTNISCHSYWNLELITRTKISHEDSLLQRG